MLLATSKNKKLYKFKKKKILFADCSEGTVSLVANLQETDCLYCMVIL